jgi:voltage-gated potassium channel
VVRSRREELRVTFGGLLLLLVTASSLMFYAEHTVQPDNFSSIPATMWYSVATITTVGYGDVVPKTGLGRLLGAMIAVLGVAFFAFPTAILGSGFVDAFSRRRAPPSCPHCGREINGAQIDPRTAEPEHPDPAASTDPNGTPASRTGEHG